MKINFEIHYLEQGFSRFDRFQSQGLIALHVDPLILRSLVFSKLHDQQARFISYLWNASLLLLMIVTVSAGCADYQSLTQYEVLPKFLYHAV
jgi:hypothetical protein